MAYNLTIPFHAFKLHFLKSNYIQVPVMDTEAIRMNEALYMLAGKYAEQFQRKVLNKGNFHQILNEYAVGSYQRAIVKIEIKAARDKISYPAFELAFDYFYTETEKGYWGIVPVLGAESFAHKLERLEINLQDAIHLEFARKQRLKSVHHIISSIWYDLIELQQNTIDFRFPGLKELENTENVNQELLLPQIAKKIYIDSQITYGRKELLDQLSKALKSRFTRNVLLVGASGVGKTAAVWEIIRQQQQRKIEGDFWETTASVMIKELTRETGWQDNLAQVCRELFKTQDILFVRNFTELFEVGQYQGNDVSMADYLRPYIGRGEVTLVSECTDEELARIELRSPNYLSLFQVIRLEEPKQDLEGIIIKKVSALAKNRKVQIDIAAIQGTLRLNRRFTPYAGLPGKPIRFLESILLNHKVIDSDKKEIAINRNTVIKYFCEETGMPLFMVDPAIKMNPIEIKKDFNNQVFGQEKAIDSIVNLLASVKTALSKTGKPIASLLFVGPTGVGKTELAKVLTQFMFGNREKMIRFDMSEFSDPYSIMRLTGLNYATDGLLTSAVRQEPFSVLLFDEIEKAHPNFFDLLLQMLSEGRLTDSRGQLVNFCSTIIIMTSNIGASNLQGNRISLKKEMETQAINTHFMSAVKQFFRPELFNRIDEVIPFAPLTEEVIRFVVKREIALFRQMEGIHHRRLELKISDEVYKYLEVIGYSPQYGARQLQRTIKEKLIIPLAQQLNLHDNEDQLIVQIEMLKEAIDIQIEVDPLGLDLLLEELEKIDYADYASELRRDICRLEEGKAFINLKSELDILERKKRRNKNTFWNDQKDSERYSYLLKTQAQLYELRKQIEEYESNVSIAFMGLANYNTEIIDQLKQWKKDLFEFKIALHSQIYPQSNHAYLAIYGRNAKPIQAIYTALARQKDFKYSIKTIWYRESLYKEPITHRTKTGEDIEELLKGRFQKKEYVIRDYLEADSQKFKPIEKGDLCCGLVFHFIGKGAYLYLKNEGGAHYWRISTEDEKRFMLQVSEKDPTIPDGIHRLDFYTKTPTKRNYYNHLLEDKVEKWTLDIKKGNYAKPLVTHIDKAFETELNKVLY